MRRTYRYTEQPHSEGLRGGSAARVLAASEHTEGSLPEENGTAIHDHSLSLDAYQSGPDISLNVRLPL